VFQGAGPVLRRSVTQVIDALVTPRTLQGARSALLDALRPLDLILGWTVLSQADWYIDHNAAHAT
jgi:hypothetical protein